MCITNLIYNYRRKHYPRTQPEYRSYDACKSFCILYKSDRPGHNAEIKKLIRQLHDDGKQIVLWEYSSGTDIQTTNLRDIRIVGPKDVSLLGTPKQKVLHDLVEKHFDVLIDLTIQPVLPLQYIALYASASLRIGCRKEDNMYDMVISMPQDTAQEELFRQVIHYLQQIRTAYV